MSASRASPPRETVLSPGAPGPRAPSRRRRVLAPEQPAGRHPHRFLDETPGCVQTRGGSTADGPASPPGPVPARRPSAPVPKGDSRKRKPRKAARRRPPRKPARPCQWASTPRQRIFRAPLPLPPHVRLSLPPPMGPASARISPNGSPAGRSARRTASVANGPSGREAFPEAKRRLGARHAAGHEPDPRVAPAAFPPCGRRNRPGRRDARAGTAAPPGDRPGPGSPSDAAASLPPAEQIRPEALRLRPHGLRVRIPPRRQQPLRQQPQLLPLPPDPGRPPQMPRRPRQARLRRPEGAARGPEKGHQIRRQRLKPPRPQDLRRPRQKRRRLGRPEAAPPDPPPRGPIRQLLRPDGRRGRLRTACSSRWRSIPGKARTQTVWPPSECAGNGISPGPDPPRALCRRDSSHPQKPGRPAASDRGSGKRTEAGARGLHRRRSLAAPRHDHPSRLSTGLIPPTERPVFSRLDRAFRLFRTQGNRPPLPHASCGRKQSAARKSGKPHGPGPPRRPKRPLRWIPGAIRPGEALRLPASFRPEGDPPGPISGSRPESSRETTGSRPGGPSPAPHPARSGEADGSPEGSPAEAGRKAPASPGAVWDRILPGPTRSMRSRTPGESPGRPRIPSTSRG